MSTFALPEDLLLAECRALQALARQLTRDRHAAEDAVQDTLVAALTRPGPQPGHVRHWLSAVLRNSLRQQHRAGQRRQRREGDAAASGPAPSANDVCEQLDLHRRLLDMVQGLEPAVRQALFLRFWRGMTARAIGDALKLPAKTVQGRIDRGLQQLRRRLDVEAGSRRAWLSMLVPLSGHGLLGLCGGMLAMKTKLLLGAAVVAILCALVPFVWPSGHDVPGSAPSQPAASVRAAEAAPSETAPRREVMVPAPAPEAEKAQPAPQVAGTVLDLQGRGVPAVEVRFERDGGEAGLAPARTAADGSFTIAFPAQEGALVVGDATWATVRRAWLSRELPAEAPVVIVAPARSYRGGVVDADGAPVAGARVVVIVDQRMVPVRAVGDKVITLPEDLGAVDSDAQGRFAFARVGWIEGARVVASHDGHEPAAIALPEASTDDLLLRLLAPSKKSCVYGVVLAADGKAAPGAMVSAGGDAVVTGDDGRFAAPFSPWGKPTAVRAVKPDVGAVSARLVPGTGQPGWSAAQPIVLQLSREPGAVQGRVVDREGRPVAGVAVWTPDLTWLGNVTASEQGHELSFGTSVEGMATAQNRATGPQSVLSIGTTTGADGSFVLRGLLPRSYALFALAPGSMLGAGPVAASPGDTVELRLEAATLRTVAGRVVSRQGAPLANVHIGLGRSFAWQRPHRDEDPWAGSPTAASGAGHVFREGGTVTDAAGRFRLEGVQVQGTRLSFDGDAVFASAPFELDGAQQLDRLEVVVDARSTFRFELVQPGEADAFRFAPDGDRHVSLFVPVEGFVMSMGQLEFAAGRTPQAYTRAGEVTVVLLRNGNEVRRSTVMLPAGGVHTLRL